MKKYFWLIPFLMPWLVLFNFRKIAYWLSVPALLLFLLLATKSPKGWRRITALVSVIVVMAVLIISLAIFYWLLSLGDLHPEDSL